MNGPRALVTINGKNVGIFTNISWGYSYDVVPISILGAYGPQESVFTGVEPVSITASGWRIIDNGPHVAAGMPQLSDLMHSPYLEISIIDRQTGKRMATFRGVRCTSSSESLHAKAPSEVTVNFMALSKDDESVTNNEAKGAATLP